MADPFGDELSIQRVVGRISPRLLYLCKLHSSFPLESALFGFDCNDKLGILDVAGMERAKRIKQKDSRRPLRDKSEQFVTVLTHV